MREIKYRCWHAGLKTYINWDLICDHHDLCGLIKSNGKIVEEFIGFKDMDGKEIYESDIVTDKYKRLMKVIYRKSKAKFAFEAIKETNFFYADLGEWFESNRFEVKVVGNIHENPELLSDKEGV